MERNNGNDNSWNSEHSIDLQRRKDSEETAIVNESDRTILLYTGDMSYDGYSLLTGACKPDKSKDVLFILYTAGGDADVAYRVARFLQNSFKRVEIYIPRICKSAGTLICIGSDTLVISEDSELGPLDVQIKKPDELIDHSSGLDILQSFDFLHEKSMETFRGVLIDIAAGGRLSTKLAVEIATKMTVGLFAPIYSQIDPVRVGEVA